MSLFRHVIITLAILGAGSLRHALADEWRIGATLPLTGPLAAAGQQAQVGLQAAVDQANAEGAVPAGHKLSLIVRDSRGRAAVAALAAHALVTEERVVALVHPVGMTSSAAEAAAARSLRVPIVGAGAVERWRRRPVRMVFPTRVSLAEEILLVFQSADAKRTGKWIVAIPETGAEAEEANRGIERARRLGYGAINVLRSDDGESLAQRAGGAEGDILLIVQPTDIAAAILASTRQARRIVTSLATPEDLVSRAGANGVIASVSLPSYRDERLPLARAYRAAMGNRPLSFASFEAFFDARVLLEGLRRSAGDRAAEVIADLLETINTEIDGVSLRYDSGLRQGVDRVWFIRLENGAFAPVATP